MKAPWFVNIHRQAAVLNRIADKFVYSIEYKSVMKKVQEMMWFKYDTYMLKQVANR